MTTFSSTFSKWQEYLFNAEAIVRDARKLGQDMAHLAAVFPEEFEHRIQDIYVRACHTRMPSTLIEGIVDAKRLDEPAIETMATEGLHLYGRLDDIRMLLRKAGAMSQETIIKLANI